jgi:hypothetical protein
MLNKFQMPPAFAKPWLCVVVMSNNLKKKKNMINDKVCIGCKSVWSNHPVDDLISKEDCNPIYVCKPKEKCECNPLKDYIETLKAKWNPKTQTRKGFSHPSGDYTEFIVYFDQYRYNWTNKQTAFEGYVFDHIRSFIKI